MLQFIVDLVLLTKDTCGSAFIKSEIFIWLTLYQLSKKPLSLINKLNDLCFN